MNEQLFIRQCKQMVFDYTHDKNLSYDLRGFSLDNVYVVWQCKTLQNNKALLSTDIRDGMYYEITYNGNEDEYYFDAYKKVENKCFLGDY